MSSRLAAAVEDLLAGPSRPMAAAAVAATVLPIQVIGKVAAAGVVRVWTSAFG